MQSQSEIGATNGSPGSHKVTPALIFTANMKECIEIRTLFGPNKNKQLWARQQGGEKVMLESSICCSVIGNQGNQVTRGKQSAQWYRNIYTFIALTMIIKH